MDIDPAVWPAADFQTPILPGTRDVASRRERLVWLSILKEGSDMDIHGSSRGKASSPEPASHRSSHRQADWLQGIGAGALGLLIGFGLGAANTPPMISPLPLMDSAAATTPPAPVLVTGSALVPPAPHDHRAVSANALPLPLALGADAAASWTSPLPGGMEPCWAERLTVTC
jgi:hypothetical protein